MNDHHHNDNDTSSSSSARPNIGVRHEAGAGSSTTAASDEPVVVPSAMVRRPPPLPPTFTFFAGVSESAKHPITGKALRVPLLNVKDRYGRQFWLATVGFMVAFMAWYSFVPLVGKPDGS